MNHQYRYRFQSAINSPYIAVIAITMLGAILRFHNLGKEPLWVDEAATWRFAQMPLSQLWGEDAIRETNPPLYYTLQHFWLIFGQSEIALRSFSAIISTITIPLLYGVGRILGGHWLGLIASALLATSTINIQYSQEVRAYGLMGTAATLSILGLAYLFTHPFQAKIIIGKGLIYSFQSHNFINSDKSQQLVADLSWIAYIIGVSIDLYCHNTAVLLLIIANIIACVWWLTTGKFNRIFFVNWILANCIPLLLWSWWIPKILKQALVTLSSFWISTPTLGTFFRTLTELYSSEYYLLIIVALASLGIWYWRHQPIKIILTLALSIGTLFLAFLISLWKPIFITRIFIWTTIPSFLIIAAGVLKLRKKSLISVALAILLTMQIYFTGSYYKQYKKEAWNQVATYVISLAKPDDMVLLFPSTIDAAFQYYFQPSLPITQYGLRRWKFNIPRLPHTRITEITSNKLNHIIQEFNRVLVVIRNRKFEDPQNILIAEISQNMALVNHRYFSQKIEVLLFEKSQPLNKEKTISNKLKDTSKL
ncbi:glycosyltransferase family 39 protein [Anabaena subtropica]|uniref:Glycosyltransferase family 39 protein n=1 Tax=Anabaena subtropica FACHB-260 TaxID=2692884 RepID=A0ABR8CQG5_9NOST|nr:glycosyltransferase family 39 protein [Anabaena subtropica]MBD2345113.1 glycosyltransferase family 39 protein [Anabaena subtropica FACHB-260]